MGESIIRLERLRKEFGDLAAVEGLDLEVGEGEFLCFLGPSGCGKTTTLRMIAGLETPTSGEIYLRGERITQLPPQRRQVGFMFQNYALFWHMTVYDNLAFGLRVRRADPATLDRKVREVAAGLELEPLLGVRAARLDLSAMQRVAMARVLAIEPEVLLLDEPLNNFRPGLREIMRGELKRSQRQLRRTMVYVTHDQEEAMTLGDRILVMNAGRAEQLEAPAAIYSHPANVFVAGFIGRPPMNFLNVEYRREGERAVLERAGLRFDVTPLREVIERGTDGRRLVLGIRPQHLRLAGEAGETAAGGGHGAVPGQPPEAHDRGSEAPAGAMAAPSAFTRGPAPTLTATVDLVQPLARKMIVDLRADGESLKMVLPSGARAARGDALRVSFPLERLHLFSAESGEALR
jgi:multiple sugar transport system ATP-binding protein